MQRLREIWYLYTRMNGQERSQFRREAGDDPLKREKFIARFLDERRRRGALWGEGDGGRRRKLWYRWGVPLVIGFIVFAAVGHYAPDAGVFNALFPFLIISYVAYFLGAYYSEIIMPAFRKTCFRQEQFIELEDGASAVSPSAISVGDWVRLYYRKTEPVLELRNGNGIVTVEELATNVFLLTGLNPGSGTVAVAEAGGRKLTEFRVDVRA